MDWFILIMFSIYFVIEVLIPAFLIIMAPFAFYYIGVFFINVYYWIKWKRSERRR